MQYQFLNRVLSQAAAVAVAMGMISSPLAMAQEGDSTTQAAPPPAMSGFNIPDDIKLFEKEDPNVRRATAVVNGDIITGTDVDQRLALIVAANEGQVPAEEMQRLRLQILRNLIDETLQIQEARASDITIEPSEIDETYARVAARNFGQDTAAMDAYLKRIGSSAASLKRQIQGELSWQRLQQRNIAPFINVSEDEVNEVLERLEASKGQDEYRIGEIYLSATEENRAQKGQLARQIVEQLRAGGSFVAYARQYSEASTAAVGGDLGWIRLAQLPADVAAVARDMQPGQLVGPIEIPGGFDIIALIDKRQVLTADPRDAILSLKQISVNFAPGVNEAQASAKARQFAETMREAKGCGAVDEVAASIGAQVVTNDQVRARDLPASLQNIVLNLSLGETSPPFGSIEDGVRVLMLCGRDDPQVAGGPSFDQLQAQLEEERINRRAQLYLRDLRRDAVIDYD